MALLASCAPAQIDVRSVVAMDHETLQRGGPFYEDGKKQLAAGQPMLALKSFQRAHLAEPRSVAVLNALGATYDDIGQFALAERYYREALALAPSDAQTLNNFGYSLVLQGKADQAAVYLEQARKAAPADTVIAGNIEQARARDAKPEVAARPAEPAAAAEGQSRPVPLVERMTEFVQALSIESVRRALTAPEEGAPLTAVALPLPPIDAAPAESPPAVREITSIVPPGAVMTLRDLKPPPASATAAAPLSPGGKRAANSASPITRPSARSLSPSATTARPWRWRRPMPRR